MRARCHLLDCGPGSPFSGPSRNRSFQRSPAKLAPIPSIWFKMLPYACCNGMRAITPACAKGLEQAERGDFVRGARKGRPASTACFSPNATMYGRRSCRSSRVPSTATGLRRLGGFLKERSFAHRGHWGFAPDEVHVGGDGRGWVADRRQPQASSGCVYRVKKDSRRNPAHLAPRLNNADKADGTAHAVPQVETQKTKTANYVPSDQPARYSSCSGDRRSILMPIDSSFSLATRLSSSSGTR